MIPAMKVAQYPMVTVRTCVVSQKLLSSTACFTSSVSPSNDKWCAITSVPKPTTAATLLPIPLRSTQRSTTRHRASTNQPMKTAEEYRLVTGGRPLSQIRTTSPPVWTTKVAHNNAKAARRKPSHPPSQPATTSRKAAA